MNHLKDIGMNYIEHLLFAWRLSFYLFVHGIFPNIWKNKASEILLDHYEDEFSESKRS